MEMSKLYRYRDQYAAFGILIMDVKNTLLMAVTLLIITAIEKG